MKTKELLLLIKLMFSNPELVWLRVKANNYNSTETIKGFVIPFTAAVSIADFLGRIATHGLLSTALISSVLFFTYLLIFAVGTVILKELSKTYKAPLSMNMCYISAAVSFTPYWLILIITGLLPGLGQIEFLSLYGVFLLWSGIGIISGMPQNKRVSFSLIYMAILIVSIYFAKALAFAIIGLFI